MAYELEIGMRYLRSKKRSTISTITFIAVTGVALGVAALLSVLSITSGFQQEFRDKVLGVNAHVLILRYGLDFTDYRRIIQDVGEMPEVAGAGPFLINEMMLAKDDGLSGVLVKGVDPDLMPSVLDLPSQIIDGSLDGMRAQGAAPPVRPGDLDARVADDDLDEFLRSLTEDAGSADAGVAAAGGDADFDGIADEALRDLIAGGDEPIVRDDGTVAVGGVEPDAGTPDGGAATEVGQALGDPPPVALPEVEVPSVADVEAALAELEGGLPSDDWEQQMLAEELELIGQEEEGTDRLPGIVVGTTLAQNLGIGVGDRVKVISPLAGLDIRTFAPEARTPRSRDFRVIGIFEAGFQEYDTRLVYVDLYEAQRFYDNGDSVTGIEITLHDLDEAGVMAQRLEQDLGSPYHTMDWATLNHNLFTALKIQKVMLSLVIATIIFVAAFNVVATLIMIVLEKKREIAILKAMGATDATVLGIFMVQGTTIGVVGTLIGLLLGGGVVAYLANYEFPLDPKVYLIDHLPVVASFEEFVWTTAIALVICMLATVMPSAYAARMLPADGVRYE